MLLFVDESWQTIGGRDIGALGAVAIPQDHYNGFCKQLYGRKRALLGTAELNEHEIKGHRCLGRRKFREEQSTPCVRAVSAMFDALITNHAKVFVVWTENPSMLNLRSTQSTALAPPYKTLLFDVRKMMQRPPCRRRLIGITFDQRDYGQDQFAACAVNNFLVRTQGGWQRHVIQVPSFSVSSVSPGLQAADVIAYLACHLADQSVRPELQPFLNLVRELAYTYTTSDGRKHRCIRHRT